MNITDAHRANTLIEWVLTTGRAGTGRLSDDTAAAAAADYFERRTGKEGNGVKATEGRHARNLITWARAIGEPEHRPLHEDADLAWSAEYLAARAYTALTAGVRPKDVVAALAADREAAEHPGRAEKEGGVEQ